MRLTRLLSHTENITKKHIRNKSKLIEGCNCNPLSYKFKYMRLLLLFFYILFINYLYCMEQEQQVYLGKLTVEYGSQHTFSFEDLIIKDIFDIWKKNHIEHVVIATLNNGTLRIKQSKGWTYAARVKRVNKKNHVIIRKIKNTYEAYNALVGMLEDKNQE